MCRSGAEQRGRQQDRLDHHAEGGADAEEHQGAVVAVDRGSGWDGGPRRGTTARTTITTRLLAIGTNIGHGELAAGRSAAR